MPEYKCSECSKVYKHRQSLSTTVDIICGGCEKHFSRKDVLKRYLEICEGKENPAKFTCNKCKKSFCNNWFLGRYLNSSHKSKNSKVNRKHNTNKVDTTENLISWNVEDGNDDVPTMVEIPSTSVFSNERNTYDDDDELVSYELMVRSEVNKYYVFMLQLKN